MPWLGASVVDSTVTVAVDQSGLPLGTFEAGIEVTHPPIASGGDPARPVQPDTILVTLLVEPPPPVPPSIELSATNVTISPTRSASVTITNGGDGALDGIRVTSGPDWALAFLSSSSAPSTLTVSAHPTIRPTAGTTGQISIAGDGVAPVTLSVTFQP